MTGDWREDALCRQVGPWLFFPGQGESPQEAKNVCASCPVRAECLEYALVTRQIFGVWGGTSEWERRKIRRLRGLQGQVEGEAA